MLGKVFSALVILSFVCGAYTGNMTNVSSALVGGVTDAVKISFSLLGMMCFWNGIMKVFDASGITSVITRAVKPILKLIYSKQTVDDKDALDDISASFAANFLGLGNAALPLGIRAVKQINRRYTKGEAGSDALMFAVLNTVPFQLVPSTLIALRSAYGSNSPFEIILPVWMCSFFTITAAVILCKLLSAFSYRRRRGRYK